MAATDDEVMAAVRRKLNITWESAETDARVADAALAAALALAPRLGFEPGHSFGPGDGPSWALYLSACLYEFSDALDDFFANYEREVSCARAINLAGGGGGAQAQG